MNVNMHTVNHPSILTTDLALKIISYLEQVEGIPSDNETKRSIREAVPFAKSTQYANAELRMDYIAHEIGLTSCMGTTAIVSRRLLATTHYHSLGMIEGVVMVCQSYNNTVEQANRGKTKKVNGNGNRASYESLSETIQALGPTYTCPTVILELDNSI